MNTTTKPKQTVKFRPTLSAAALRLLYNMLVEKLNTVHALDSEYAAIKEAYLNIGRTMLTSNIAPERAAYVTTGTGIGNANSAFALADSLGLGLEELSEYEKFSRNLETLSEEEKADLNRRQMEAVLCGAEIPLK